MPRVPLASAACVLTLAVTPAAIAATINGSPNRDRLNGTSSADVIHGGGRGSDRLDGRGGDDRVFGDTGPMRSSAPRRDRSTSWATTSSREKTHNDTLQGGQETTCSTAPTATTSSTAATATTRTADPATTPRRGRLGNDKLLNSGPGDDYLDANSGADRDVRGDNGNNIILLANRPDIADGG